MKIAIKIVVSIMVAALMSAAWAEGFDCAVLQEMHTAAYVPEKWNVEAREKYAAQRFGVFVHWGLYSNYAQGEWYLQQGGVEEAAYARMMHGFCPSKFDAKEWVRIVKGSGAQYLTITSRHHDGFSLWPTKVDDGYNIANTPFSPFRQGYGSGFTEGNSWQYTWHVLHEPEALMDVLGGKEAFCDKLKGLFRQPEKVNGMEVVADATGLIGQYAHGNEPSHHVAFLFALAGRPERTDELVREICTKFYRPTPDGLCGNDDCGQMSAWYVWACLGRYPLDPCGGWFVTFKPVMKDCKISRAR